MGWSCGQYASLRMDAIGNACRKMTGSSNGFESNGNKYFVEWSRRGHRDGAVTGTIMREQTKCDDLGITYCSRSGSIRIEGNGVMTRGPKMLKEIPARVLVVDNKDIGLWKGEADDEALERFMKQEYMKQFYKGGVNHHVTMSLGYIPYPTDAHIINLQTCTPLAVWRAAMFEVW